MSASAATVAGLARDHRLHTKRLLHVVSQLKLARNDHLTASMRSALRSRLHEEERWRRGLQLVDDDLHQKLNIVDAVHYAASEWTVTKAASPQRYVARRVDGRWSVVDTESGQPVARYSKDPGDEALAQADADRRNAAFQPPATPQPVSPNAQEVASRLTSQLNTASWVAQGVQMYLGMAAPTGQAAGQASLNHLGLHQTFEWAHPRNMAQDLYQVRGSKVIQAMHGSHVGQLSKLIVDATNPRTPKTIAQVMKEIDQRWPGMRRYQVERIARTETATLWTHTAVQSYAANGITEFESLVAQGPMIGIDSDLPCDECEAAASDGPWPIEESIDLPPWHPNCRCEAVPVLEGPDGEPWLPPDEPWTGGDLPVEEPQLGSVGQTLPVMPDAPGVADTTELTGPERVALLNYVSGMGSWINGVLRGGIKEADLNWIQADNYVRDVNGIDSAIAKQVPLERGITVWRADEDLFWGAKSGQVIRDDGFASTTMEEGGVKRFGNVIAEIRVPVGSRVLDLNDLHDPYVWSKAGEREVILPRGGSYRVIDSSPQEENILGKKQTVTVEWMPPSEPRPLESSSLEPVPEPVPTPREIEPNHRYVLEDSTGEKRGEILFSKQPDTVWVSSVESDLKGGGTELMRTAARSAKEAEWSAGVAPSVSLHAVPDARGFYEKLGFTSTDGKLYRLEGEALDRLAARSGEAHAAQAGTGGVNLAFDGKEINLSDSNAVQELKYWANREWPDQYSDMTKVLRDSQAHLDTVEQKGSVLVAGEGERLDALAPVIHYTTETVGNIHGPVTYVDALMVRHGPGSHDVELQFLRKIAGQAYRRGEALAIDGNSVSNGMQAFLKAHFHTDEVTDVFYLDRELLPREFAFTPEERTGVGITADTSASARLPVEVQPTIPLAPGNAFVNPKNPQLNELYDLIEKSDNGFIRLREGTDSGWNKRPLKATVVWADKDLGMIFKYESDAKFGDDEALLRVQRTLHNMAKDFHGIVPEAEPAELVQVLRGDSPDLAYWRKKKGWGPNSTIAAQASARGRITFWRGESNLNQDTFDHEMGHVLGGVNNNGPHVESEWSMAQTLDKRHANELGIKFNLGRDHGVMFGERAVTPYGATAIQEDWAESLMLYMRSKRTGTIFPYGIRGLTYTGQEKFTFEEAFPNRTRLLEKWIRGIETQPEFKPVGWMSSQELEAERKVLQDKINELGNALGSGEGSKATEAELKYLQDRVKEIDKQLEINRKYTPEGGGGKKPPGGEIPEHIRNLIPEGYTAEIPSHGRNISLKVDGKIRAKFFTGGGNVRLELPHTSWERLNERQRALFTTKNEKYYNFTISKNPLVAGRDENEVQRLLETVKVEFSPTSPTAATPIKLQDAAFGDVVQIGDKRYTVIDRVGSRTIIRDEAGHETSALGTVEGTLTAKPTPVHQPEKKIFLAPQSFVREGSTIIDEGLRQEVTVVRRGEIPVGNPAFSRDTRTGFLLRDAQGNEFWRGVRPDDQFRIVSVEKPAPSVVAPPSVTTTELGVDQVHEGERVWIMAENGARHEGTVVRFEPDGWVIDTSAGEFKRWEPDIGALDEQTTTMWKDELTGQETDQLIANLEDEYGGYTSGEIKDIRNTGESYARGLTNRQTAAIDDYVYGDAGYVDENALHLFHNYSGGETNGYNYAVRNAKRDDPTKVMNEVADELAGAIDAGPKLPEMTLLRAVSDHDFITAEGETFIDNGFMSTTASVHALDTVVSDFIAGNQITILEMDMPAGFKGLYLDPTNPNGAFGVVTDEILLQRGSRFEVTNISIDPSGARRVKLKYLGVK